MSSKQLLKPFPRIDGRSFTLVEIMVAVSVLALLMAIVAQIISMTSRSIRLSSQPVDASTQARLALDRIGLDLAHLVERPDVDIEIQNSSLPSQNLLIFLSIVPTSGLSSTSSRGVSLIAYQMNVSTDNPGPNKTGRLCLLRAGIPLSWNGTGATGYFGLQANGLPYLFTNTAFPAPLPATTNFDMLAQGVIRLCVGFQLYPDNNPVTLEDGTPISNSRGQLVYSPPVKILYPNDGTTPITVLDVSRISALVVGLVAIDLKSLQMLNATQVAAIAQTFPTPSSTQNINQTPVNLWAPIANNATSIPNSVPLIAFQAVRVFQRFYPVTSFGAPQ